jgi:hypothetical protein
MVGLFCATVVIGLWPLLLGFSKGRPLLGLTGFFACIAGGYAFGCFGSFPIALVFQALIGSMNRPKPPDRDEPPDAPFNPYANGKRSAF